jgi:hypothetical protein
MIVGKLGPGQPSATPYVEHQGTMTRTISAPEGSKLADVMGQMNCNNGRTGQIPGCIVGGISGQTRDFRP